MELSKEMSEGRAFGRTNKTAMIVQEGNLAKRFFLRQSKLRRNEFAKLGIPRDFDTLEPRTLSAASRYLPKTFGNSSRGVRIWNEMNRY